MAGKRAVLPISSDEAGRRLADVMDAGEAGRPADPGTLIACTSGSTGTPKGAVLTADALTASAEATASYFHEHHDLNPGPWLLALPPHHIAGVQVILRSLHAGFEPAVLPATGRFTTESFAEATAMLRLTHPDEDLYTSLVPTQLRRMLDDADRVNRASGTADDVAAASAAMDGLVALRLYSAILVGGAACPADLVERCAAEGIRIVRTYGSSETAGGMVYDGHPIPGTSVEIEDADPDGVGRVLLGGPTVAAGYRNVDSAEAFPAPHVFRTSDLGRLDDGVLSILGRADGAITSGGLKILPEDVERALADSGFTACVTGLPDEQWGQIVVAVVEKHVGDISELVRTTLRDAGVEPHLIPRRAFGLGEDEALPVTGPGKLDRQAVKRLAETKI
ncbi:MAG TPA: AMP-binding protein [Candidatus Corynebacterium avicola]|uniref:AMP-binding protein n=1 Tax=Candidatus Corynebacterium avicola TaxID=2838527 RepID=A0A9D1UKN2_9CORY|nr:AMP-binding protein [Candidatus Corynebacterium avicola]